MWIMFGASGVALAVYAAHSAIAHRSIVWTYDANEALTGAPVIGSDGAVFTCIERSVIALDGATGKKRWSFTFPSAGEYQNSEVELAEDNTLFVNSFVNQKPHLLYRLDATTGRVVSTSSPSSLTSITGGDDRLSIVDNRIVAVNPVSGNKVWEFKPPPRPDNDVSVPNNNGSIETAHATGNTVYAVFGCPYKLLYAIDSTTGKPRWNAPLNQTEMGACGIDVSLTSLANGIPVVSDVDDTIRAFNPSNGHTLWKLSLDHGFMPVQMLVAPHNVLYFGTYDGTVYAIDGGSGKVMWRQHIGEKIWYPPVISADGKLYVGTQTNKVYALDPKNGATKWHVSFGFFTRSFPYGDSVALKIGRHGLVYCASTDGRLYAIHEP